MNYILRKLLPDPGWLSTVSQYAIAAGLTLIAVDLLFLLLHLALNFGLLSDRGFHMEVDGGYSELFQYFKYVVCAAILLVLGIRYSGLLRFFFAFVFTLLFLEDWRSFHENFHVIGSQFVTLHDTFGLRKAEIWELIYAILIGVPLMGLLAYALLRAKDDGFLPRAKYLLLGILLLAGFGVGVDMLHGLSQSAGLGPYFESSIGMIEDWGEMLSLSGLVVLVIDDWVQSRQLLSTVSDDPHLPAQTLPKKVTAISTTASASVSEKSTVRT